MPGIAHQYRIIEDGAGWRQSAERGRLRFSGADRLVFLQALLTNDVESLAPGQGAYAAYLTPQGRMIADLHLFARADHVVADVPVAVASALATTFDQLIFSEDVSVTDISPEMAHVTVIGGAAPRILAAAFGIDVAVVRDLPVWSHLDVADGFVARTDDAKLPGYCVFVSTPQESEATARISGVGATRLTDELCTALRIDAGRPLFGVDMDTDTIPLEAGIQERAISTTKGCYVGQEVIIRVLHRGGGRVAKKLVKIASEASAPSVLHTNRILHSADREAGKVTSVAESLDGAGTIGLASVRREFAEIGQEFSIESSPLRAVITGIVE